MTKPIPVITIDGPSGAGKGTVARLLAARLGFHYLDSGALYRGLAIAAQHHGLDTSQERALAVLAENLDITFELKHPEQGVQVLFEGEDITDKLRLESTGNMASKLSAHPSVRQALLARQHAYREAPGLVTDGRDMGTVVFPDATHKFFLTASPEIRAQRRLKELQNKGESVNLGALLADIRERDERDANRAVSPLKPADNAILIDTTGLSIPVVLAKITDAL